MTEVQTFSSFLHIVIEFDLFLTFHQSITLDVLRTQAWAHRIPFHLHYGKDRVRIPYDHRYCPSPDCPSQTLGDELHVLTACAPTDPFWKPQNELFKGLARLCQMHHFFTSHPTMT